MSDVRSVIVGTRNPLGEGDTGSAEQGWYVVEGDTLTLTTADGVPLRDERTGQRIVHHLLPNENAKGVAKNLTLRRWRASQPDDNGFNRPIRYSNAGIA
jgi:hypothetical protein